MLNVEVVKQHFVNIFAKIHRKYCLGNGIVKTTSEQYIIYLFSGLEEVGGKLQKVICQCVHTWTFSDKTIFVCYVHFVLLCI